MMDLFDAAAARDAKLAAMKQSETNADKPWSELMLRLVKLVCQEQLMFTADEPFEHYELLPEPKPTTHDPRAFGPVMARAVKEGYCEPTNVTQKSRRPSCHHRPLAVWRSKLYGYGK